MVRQSTRVKDKFKLGCSPNPKQLRFFKSKKKYIAYGGARAGGKSWAMRVKFVLLALNYNNLKLLLLRRTYPELEANHIIPLQLMLKGIAKYVSAKKCFYFPNGSILKLGYCKTDGDAIQYHGHEYDVIGFEEATLFSEWQLTFIATCARNVRTDFMPRLYYTCNPGGIGHSYIKRLFIDREYENEENPNDYEFIPALIYDNEILMKNDPTYLKILNNLPEELRRAHRDGDWDALSGQYFREFNRSVHVIEPFEIPREWNRYITIDYGLDKFAAYFIAVDYDKNCYVYKEIYKENLIISDAAKIIKETILPDEKIKYIYGPPDLESRRQDTGKSALQIFLENDIVIVTTRNDRIPGWLCIKEMLNIKEITTQDGDKIRTAQLKFFSNVKSLIKNLPMVQRDDKDPNDIAKEPHELTHGPDALRYFCSKFLEVPKIKTEGIKGTWTYQQLLMKGFSAAKIKKMRDSGQVKVI